MNCKSKIFTPYRGLGLVSNGVPLFQTYASNIKENFIFTVVGNCFHEYSATKLRLTAVGTLHDSPITCIAASGIYTYTASGNYVYAWKRKTDLVNRFGPHCGEIHTMIIFCSHVISVDKSNTLRIWSTEPAELHLEIEFPPNFGVTCLLHPVTYMNKILLGSQEGNMQLWNIKSNKMIHSFTKWNAKITVLEQAPAIDVVAVGLENGRIILHNLKYDETILEFQQDWGSVTSISFRTDNTPIMVTGSERGHIALWDIGEKRLLSQLQNAHGAPVTGLQCLPNEPLMVSSSADNTLKMWIFDMPDGGARLYNSREGHSAPPLVARFHGNLGDTILSSGEDCTVRTFSTVTDNINKNLGTAVIHKSTSKNISDLHKLPPIIAFTSETTQEKPWEDVAALHRRHCIVSTWSIKQNSMGKHRLAHDRFKARPFLNAVATCVEATVCGNFVIIGYDSGHIDKFNLQSALYRGSFGKPLAHQETVTGILTDDMNQIMVSGDQDGILKRWRLKNHSNIGQLKFESPISKMILHRESGLIGCVLDDWTIIVIDIDAFCIIRRLTGHTDQVTDITLTPDAHWLISASLDRTVRTWDLPSGKCIDCFIMPISASSITMSPKGDFLATVHAGQLGVYLWTNLICFQHIDLQPLPEDYVPSIVSLPTTMSDNTKLVEGDEPMDIDEKIQPEYITPAQISENLVTLALLPTSRWLNLINVDIIKKRNKPIAPPIAPKAAPFFIPTVPGLEFAFAPSEQKEKSSSSKIKHLNVFLSLSTFGEALKNKDYDRCIEMLMKMNPSAIDLEIKGLDPDIGGAEVVLVNFLKMVKYIITKRTHFEAVQGYLGLYLKIHSNFVINNEEAQQICGKILKSQTAIWGSLQEHINQSLSLLSYLKNSSMISY